MAEVTHVFVKVEPVKDAPGTFSLFAEAGYPDTEEVITCVELEPDAIASDPAANGGRSLDWVLWHLADALAEEGVVMTTADLRERVVVDAPPGFAAPE